MHNLITVKLNTVALSWSRAGNVWETVMGDGRVIRSSAVVQATGLLPEAGGSMVIPPGCRLDTSTIHSRDATLDKLRRF